MRVSIKLTSGKVLSSEYEATSITIGRSNKCDFPVADEALSRTHAQLEVIDGEFFITDLGSANGVYIDGTRVPAQSKTKFNVFQQLTIGPLECQIEDTSDAPEPTPAYPSRKVPDSSFEQPTPSRPQRTAPTSGHGPAKKVAADKKSTPGKLDIKKMLPIILLVAGVGAYLFFKSAEEIVENKSPDEQLVLSNVPEALRDVKDDFGDYLVVYAGNGCEKDAELCKEMKLSGQNGEGLVREGKEIYIFINPSSHLNQEAFSKVKEHTDSSDIIALYILMTSSLMTEFDKKAIGQIHLVILDKDLKQSKVFRFHQKYFAGNEVGRMLTELGEVVENGSKTEAFWTYAKPMIKIKNF
jgi:hypothetical protein